MVAIICRFHLREEGLLRVQTEERKGKTVENLKVKKIKIKKKIVDLQLERRVMLAQELSKQLQQAYKGQPPPPPHHFSSSPCRD